MDNILCRYMYITTTTTAREEKKKLLMFHLFTKTFTKLIELGFNPLMGVVPTVIDNSLLFVFKAADNSFTNETKFSSSCHFPHLNLFGYSRSTYKIIK